MFVIFVGRLMVFVIGYRYLRPFRRCLDMAEVGSSNLPGPTINQLLATLPDFLGNILAIDWQNERRIQYFLKPTTPPHPDDDRPMFIRTAAALAGRTVERIRQTVTLFQNTV